MQKKLTALIHKYRSVLIYLIFGVLTTGVNYLVFYPCYNQLKLSAAVSNGIAWFCSVIFAFLTNKAYVFESRDWSARIMLPELVNFTGTRIASGLLESGILAAVEFFGWNVNLWKIPTGVLVIIINYIGSKLLVFRRKK